MRNLLYSQVSYLSWSSWLNHHHFWIQFPSLDVPNKCPLKCPYCRSADNAYPGPDFRYIFWQRVPDYFSTSKNDHGQHNLQPYRYHLMSSSLSEWCLEACLKKIQYCFQRSWIWKPGALQSDGLLKLSWTELRRRVWSDPKFQKILSSWILYGQYISRGPLSA